MAAGGQISFLLGNTRDKRFNDRPEKKKKKNPVYEKRWLNQAWAPTVGLSIGPAGLVWQVSERSLNIQSLNHYQMRGASGNQTELMEPALPKPPVGSAGPGRSISASCFSLPTLIVQ